MRKFNFFYLIILCIAGCASPDQKMPIEGGWKLVYAQSSTAKFNYPLNVTGTGVKSWSSGTFVFSGEYKIDNDTTTVLNFGWGTFKLQEANKYEETILYHHLSKSSVGAKIKMLVEVRNDTLYQMWPVDDKWQLLEKHNTEKYVRLK